MTVKYNVPFFPYPDIFKKYEKNILEIVADVCRRGAFILQKDVDQFEKNLAEYIGVKYVLGVANATDALYMLCRASGLGPGDEVIFCSHTMVATAAGIHFAGATPVPVDTGWDHQIDPKSIEKAITAKTKAIMPTQLNGRCADMDALRTIAQKHGLFILEDSAQALGAKYKGQCAGTFGRGGVISFYPAKTLGCLGDGGCIVTNDDEIYEKCKLYRDHGRIDTLEVLCWCLNSRLDNLQAAILDFKLKTYDQEVECRRLIAAMYQERLKDIEEIILPPGPEDNPDWFDIYQNYEIEAQRRDDLKAYLSDKGIGTMIQWGGKAVHEMKKLGFTQSLPYTEELFNRLLMLPMNTSLTDEDVGYVCSIIREYYQK
jgi:dTDP-4-amino-4,6-dideoxygalactose transaminase